MYLKSIEIQGFKSFANKIVFEFHNGITGIVGHNEKGFALLEQKNKFLTGETIEVMIPGGENLQVTVKAIEDEDGVSMESAPHPRQMIYVDFGEEIPEGYLLRRKEE